MKRAGPAAPHAVRTRDAAVPTSDQRDQNLRDPLEDTRNSYLQGRTTEKTRKNWLTYSEELFYTINTIMDHFYGYNTRTATINPEY